MSDKAKRPAWKFSDEKRVERVKALYDAVPAEVRSDVEANRKAMRSIADTLADEFGFERTEVSPRSVVSKLVAEGVYEKPDEKPKAPKDEGPSKKDILAACNAADPDFAEFYKGFEPATKAALKYLADKIGADV